MTIVLYVEDDIRTLRQMFVDASKTKRIEGNTVTRFDQRDAFNQVAVRLADSSSLFKGRVEMDRSTAARTSRNLLAVNQLAAILKSLEVGYGRRVSRDLNDYHMRNLDDLYRRCLAWSDDFMPATREEYGGLLSGSIDNSEIPQLRTSTFAYNVSFIRVLAACYFRWMREYESWNPLAGFIRRASITPGSGYGLLVDVGLVSPGGTSLLARRQEVAMATEHIVRAIESAACLKCGRKQIDCVCQKDTNPIVVGFDGTAQAGSYGECKRFGQSQPRTQARAQAQKLRDQGLSLSQIARRLNGKGYRTNRGKSYTYQTVWHLLNRSK